VNGRDEEATVHELVILKRPIGGEDAPHKGGVWKIAYADFMTAMMAFFLVMWLINATDKQTLTQVATYFNPLRLTDKAPSSRGLHHSEVGAQANDRPSGSPKQQPASAKSDNAAQGKGEGAKPKHAEEALFRDPQGLLTRLANQAEEEKQPTDAPGRRSGEAYRDPFEPAFRRPAQDDRPEPAKPQPPADVRPTPPPEAAAAPTPTANPPTSIAIPSTSKERAAEERAAEARKAAEQAAERATAAKLEAQIKQVIAQSRPGTVPHIDVTVTEEGVLISLTDDYDFGMFAIASAEPRPAMVVVMEKLGKVLAGQPERLIVRGHTDGRRYKSGTYDNWRLSTARAHMAYYMLLRGGIDEKRFERVEGHADRNLRIANDPEAAQNRRIEILLRKPKP
jgi:chemotaxis protein MotB